MKRRIPKGSYSRDRGPGHSSNCSKGGKCTVNLRGNATSVTEKIAKLFTRLRKDGSVGVAKRGPEVGKNSRKKKGEGPKHTRY